MAFHLSRREEKRGRGKVSFFLFCYGRRNTLEKNLGYSLLAPVQTKVSFCKVSRLRRRRRRRVVELSLERRSPSSFLRRPPTLVLMPSRSHLLPLGRSIAVPSRGKGGEKILVGRRRGRLSFKDLQILRLPPPTGKEGKGGEGMWEGCCKLIFLGVHRWAHTYIE